MAPSPKKAPGQALTAGNDQESQGIFDVDVRSCTVV
jgi:hypothetical protein